MKKILLAMALVLALALPAHAEVNGVYAGIKIIDSLQATGDVSKSAEVKGYGIGSYGQNTIGGGIYLGYDFYPKFQMPIRTEIEYAIRSNMDTSWNQKNIFEPNDRADTDYTMGLQTLFFNAYLDLHNSTAFTPYIGAGVGMGFISNKLSVDYKDDINGLDNYNDSKNKMNTVFAWNVGAGVSYAMTENVSADLAYRFVGLGENNIADGFKTHPYANEVSLGMRFTF